jgi:hypothetical protein
MERCFISFEVRNLENKNNLLHFGHCFTVFFTNIEQELQRLLTLICEDFKCKKEQIHITTFTRL